jgi:predicted  nucleic acid-binding Zn-ribbon protein
MQEGANQRKLLMDEQEKLRVELLHALEHEKKQSAELEDLTKELAKCKDYIKNSDMELESLKENLASLQVVFKTPFVL